MFFFIYLINYVLLNIYKLTGNDLARVLCWGSGYTGDQDPLSYLREVIDAEDIRLDRWTVVFHPEEKPEEQTLKVTTNTTGKKKKAHQAHLSQQTDQHHQEPAITSSDKSGLLITQNFLFFFLSKTKTTFFILSYYFSSIYGLLLSFKCFSFVF